VKIMVADDSPTFGVAVAKLLTQMGHEPVPDEALCLAKGRGRNCGLLAP